MAHCTDNDSSLRVRPPAQPAQSDESAGSGSSEHVAHYRLGNRIGDGRLGPLYIADDAELHRPTALRLIRDRLTDDPKFMARLDQNIRAASKLRHPGIASIYGAGVDPGRGRIFITMEFCPGEPLSVILARCQRLEFRDALNLGIQVCRALSYMHSRAIIHGEIKPTNVILDPCGVARVLDCGLPSGSNMTDTSATSTQTGKSLGASQYISPEAVRGEKLDVRADVYSVGAMLFHLMTGEKPFSAPDIPTLVLKQLYEAPRNAHAVHACVPESVAAVLSKAMEKSADQRYADCTELIAEFERVREGRPSSQPRVTPVKPTADANEKSKLTRSGFSQKLMAVLKNFQF